MRLRVDGRETVHSLGELRRAARSLGYPQLLSGELAQLESDLDDSTERLRFGALAMVLEPTMTDGVVAATSKRLVWVRQEQSFLGKVFRPTISIDSLRGVIAEPVNDGVELVVECRARLVALRFFREDVAETFATELAKYSSDAEQSEPNGTKQLHAGNGAVAGAQNRSSPYIDLSSNTTGIAIRRGDLTSDGKGICPYCGRANEALRQSCKECRAALDWEI